MARIQFASGRQSLCPPSLSTITGTITGTFYFWIQARNDVGYNLHDDSASITLSNQGVRLTIPSDAYRVGENWHRYSIHINTTNNPATSVCLLHIDAQTSSQNPISLPLNIDITHPSQIEFSSRTVSTLPTTNLLNGMLREYTPTGKIYRYVAGSTASVDGENVLSASSGRWIYYPDPFETYITSTTDSSLGCDTSVSDLDETRNIINFDYALDGTSGLFRRYWIFNDYITPIPQGKRISASVINSSEDVTDSYYNLLGTVFEGHFDQTLGELITTLSDDITPLPYLNVDTPFERNQDNFVIQRDLEQNQAWQVKIYPSFKYEDISSQTNVPALNSEVEIFLGLFTDTSTYTELGAFIGNSILPGNSGFRRIYPLEGLSCLADTGSGVVDNRFWRDVPASTVVGLETNTEDQIVAVNSQGSCYVVTSLASNEDQRALVSTLEGESKASSFSSQTQGDNDPNLTFTVVYPTIIRANYLDIIAGSSKGDFNASSINLYVRKRSSLNGSITQTKKFTGLSPTNLVSDSFTVLYSNGTTYTGSIPNTEFGLFTAPTPTSISITNTSGGYYYDLAVSFVYDGSTVVDISHEVSDGNIQTIYTDFSTISTGANYWRSPLNNLTALSNISSTELLDNAYYPVKSGTSSIPEIYVYSSSDTQVPNGTTIIDCVNGAGNFLQKSGVAIPSTVILSTTDPSTAPSLAGLIHYNSVSRILRVAKNTVDVNGWEEIEVNSEVLLLVDFTDLKAINTNSISPFSLRFVLDNSTASNGSGKPQWYVFISDSTATEDLPNVVAPVTGPGRWIGFAAGGSGGGGGGSTGLTSNVTYYIDSSDGNDDNTGLVAGLADPEPGDGAWLDLQTSIDKVAAMELNGYTVTLQLSSGYFGNVYATNDPIYLRPLKSFGKIIIQGSGTLASSIENPIRADGVSGYTFSNVEFSSGYEEPYLLFKDSNIRIGACRFGGSPYVPYNVIVENSYLEMYGNFQVSIDPITGTFLARRGSQIWFHDAQVTYSLSDSGTSGFLNATELSLIKWENMTKSGSLPGPGATTIEATGGKVVVVGTAP